MPLPGGMSARQPAAASTWASAGTRQCRCSTLAAPGMVWTTVRCAVQQVPDWTPSPWAASAQPMSGCAKGRSPSATALQRSTWGQSRLGHLAAVFGWMRLARPTLRHQVAQLRPLVQQRCPRGGPLGGSQARAPGATATCCWKRPSGAPTGGAVWSGPAARQRRPFGGARRAPRTTGWTACRPRRAPARRRPEGCHGELRPLLPELPLPRPCHRRLQRHRSCTLRAQLGFCWVLVPRWPGCLAEPAASGCRRPLLRLSSVPVRRWSPNPAADVTAAWVDSEVSGTRPRRSTPGSRLRLPWPSPWSPHRCPRRRGPGRLRTTRRGGHGPAPRSCTRAGARTSRSCRRRRRRRPAARRQRGRRRGRATRRASSGPRHPSAPTGGAPGILSTCRGAPSTCPQHWCRAEQLLPQPAPMRPLPRHAVRA
mmetsp:Transcript_10285/g.31954  ORF Transcript_10285/g.31954 Transcript_10285/m.31954 type:complete len:424 (-) Transcript_10285:135-1406(-)